MTGMSTGYINNVDPQMAPISYFTKCSVLTRCRISARRDWEVNWNLHLPPEEKLVASGLYICSR